jgi:hypothetical protein
VTFNDAGHGLSTLAAGADFPDNKMLATLDNASTTLRSDCGLRAGAFAGERAAAPALIAQDNNDEMQTHHFCLWDVRSDRRRHQIPQARSC